MMKASTRVYRSAAVIRASTSILSGHSHHAEASIRGDSAMSSECARSLFASLFHHGMDAAVPVAIAILIVPPEVRYGLNERLVTSRIRTTVAGQHFRCPIVRHEKRL